MGKKIKILGIIVLTAIIVLVMIACDEEKDVDTSQYYLNTPTGVVASKLSDDKIHITWNAVSGASEYEIAVRSNLDSADTRLYISKTTNTSYEHYFYSWYWWYYSKPEEVKTIYYYVKAYPNVSGYIASNWSAPISVNTR